MGATYGYQSLIAYFPKLGAAIAVGTSLETDTQQHPADTLCFAYNKAIERRNEREHERYFVKMVRAFMHEKFP